MQSSLFKSSHRRNGRNHFKPPVRVQSCANALLEILRCLLVFNCSFCCEFEPHSPDSLLLLFTTIAEKLFQVSLLLCRRFSAPLSQLLAILANIRIATRLWNQLLQQAHGYLSRFNNDSRSEKLHLRTFVDAMNAARRKK